jgi:hypothetical protein
LWPNFRIVPSICMDETSTIMKFRLKNQSLGPNLHLAPSTKEARVPIILLWTSHFHCIFRWSLQGNELISCHRNIKPLSFTCESRFTQISPVRSRQLHSLSHLIHLLCHTGGQVEWGGSDSLQCINLLW